MHLFPVYHVRYPNFTLCFCERFHLPHNIRWSSGHRHLPHRHYWLQTQRRHTRTPTKDQKISRRHTQTPTKDQRIWRGTIWLLQRIIGYQGGTLWLLQRIIGYQGGTHLLLQRIKGYQEAHFDSYKGSNDIKRHTLTPTKTQISDIERHTSTSMEISKAHTDQTPWNWYQGGTLHAASPQRQRYQRGYKKRPRYRGGKHQILQKYRYQRGPCTHLLLERNTEKSKRTVRRKPAAPIITHWQLE